MRISSAVLAVLSALALVQSHSVDNECVGKEKCRAFLELTGDAIMKAMDSLPDCTENDTVIGSHSGTCGQKEKTISYLNVALTLIEQTRDQFPNCLFRNISEPDPEVVDFFPRDCSEVQSRGLKTGGVYTIWPRGHANQSDSVKALCDTMTDGGGWTVIQRRGNFSEYPEDFFRKWEDYKHGFGNVTGEYWIGNDNIHSLTNDNRTELRFDLWDVDGEHRHAVYRQFRVGDEDSQYELRVGNYTGDAGDTLTFSDGMSFSTRDRCHDRRFGPPPCAVQNRSGWWFRDCTLSNPNGVLKPGRDGVTGLYWNEWKLWECLAKVEIKVRTRRS